MTAPALFDLTDRVAVVTGAGGSLGRAIAIGLAEAGASLALLDVQPDALEATAAAVRERNRPAVAVPTDVANEAAVEAAFAAVDAAYGRIDILVNNAAAPVERVVPEAFPLDAWERSLAVNLTGYFLCARAAGARMVAAGRGGSIVNMSSIAGSSALGRGNFAYSVSKGGVNQLTRELAVEWAQHGIRVNAIQPVQFHNAAWEAMTGGSVEAGARRARGGGDPARALRRAGRDGRAGGLPRVGCGRDGDRHPAPGRRREPRPERGRQRSLGLGVPAA